MQYTIFHSDASDVSLQTLSGNAFSQSWPFNFGLTHSDDHSFIFVWTKYLGGVNIQLRKLKAKTNNIIFNFRAFQG